MILDREFLLALNLDIWSCRWGIMEKRYSLTRRFRSRHKTGQKLMPATDATRIKVSWRICKCDRVRFEGGGTILILYPLVQHSIETIRSAPRSAFKKSLASSVCLIFITTPRSYSSFSTWSTRMPSEIVLMSDLGKLTLELGLAFCQLFMKHHRPLRLLLKSLA